MAILRGIDRRAEHLQAIGKVAVYHTYLQYELATGLEALLGVSSEHAELLASELSFRKLLAVLSEAAHGSISDERLLSELVELLKRAGDAEETRNRCVHSVWAVSLDLLFSDSVLRQKPKASRRGPLSVQTEVVDVQTIQSTAEELKILLDDCAHFWPKLNATASQGSAAARATRDR